MGLQLTDEAMRMIRIVTPIVDAINSLFASYHIATDMCHDIGDELENWDELPEARARDIGNEAHEELWRSANEMVEPFGMKVQFNRVDGQFHLMEK